ELLERLDLTADRVLVLLDPGGERREHGGELGGRESDAIDVHADSRRRPGARRVGREPQQSGGAPRARPQAAEAAGRQPAPRLRRTLSQTRRKVLSSERISRSPSSFAGRSWSVPW